MAEADWERIRTEYITGRESLRTLCERCGVAYSSISKRSSVEKWAQQRKEYAKTVQKKGPCAREHARRAQAGEPADGRAEDVPGAGAADGGCAEAAVHACGH